VNETSGEHAEGEALLHPSEFRAEGDGPFINITSANRGFFREFSDHVRMKKLENIFGLEVIQSQAPRMIELSFDTGNLLLGGEEMKLDLRNGTSQFSLRETSWAIKVEGELVCQAGETQCVTYASGYVKWTNSLAKQVSDIVDILTADGLLAM
jgi:hypothetical protein